MWARAVPTGVRVAAAQESEVVQRLRDQLRQTDAVVQQLLANGLNCSHGVLKLSAAELLQMRKRGGKKKVEEKEAARRAVALGHCAISKEDRRVSAN